MDKFRDLVLLLILHSLLLPSFACFHSEEPIDLEDRAQYIMRYSAVAPLLTNGSVSLLWYLDELCFVCLLWLRCLMFTNSDCRQKIFGCDFNFVGCLRELDSREASRKKIHERNFYPLSSIPIFKQVSLDALLQYNYCFLYYKWKRFFLSLKERRFINTSILSGHWS